MNSAPDLKRQALHGMRWLGLGSVAGTLLQVVQQLVLVRFIAPAEFGIAGLVTSVSLFAATLVDFGISNAIVHRKELTPRQLQSLFWFNVGMAVVLAASVLALASPVAHYYGSPQMAPFLRWSSLVFLLLPLGQQYRALHQKHLAFGVIARNELWATVASVVVSIGLAMLGYAAAALVGGFLARHVAQNLLFWWAGRRLFRPAWQFAWADVRPLASYGLYQMPLVLLGTVITEFDKFCMGRVLGMQPTGIYDGSRTFVQRPMWVLTPLLTRVTFPVFAQLQDDIPRLRRAYVTTMRSLALVNLPIYAIVLVAADPLVRVFFGARWLEAIPVVRLLAIYCMCKSVMNPMGPLFIGIGHLRQLGVGSVTHAVLLVAGVLLGTQWGLLGVATAVVLVQALMWLFFSQVLLRPALQASLWEVMEPGITTGGLALLAAIPGIFLAQLPLPEAWFHWMPAAWLGRLDVAGLVQLVLTTAVCGGLYALLLWRFSAEGKRLLKESIFHR